MSVLMHRKDTCRRHMYKYKYINNTIKDIEEKDVFAFKTCTAFTMKKTYY